MEESDALLKAISMVGSSIEATSLDGYNSRMIAATAYAAIAQAEQLKRIADALYSQNWNGSQAVGETLMDIWKVIGNLDK